MNKTACCSIFFVAGIAIIGIVGCKYAQPPSETGSISPENMARLERLVDNPPPDMSDEEIASEIAALFPKRKRDDSMLNYEQIHLYAMKALPSALVIEEKFDSVDHFISNFGARPPEKSLWNTEAFFGGRYTLTMQVEIEIDFSGENFKVVGIPTYYFVEAAEVRRDGACLGGQSHTLNQEQFEQLVGSNWDFEAIGISIHPSPVTNFKIFEAMTRSSRYPISLLVHESQHSTNETGTGPINGK